MRRSSVITLICTSLAFVGTTCWLGAAETPKKPTKNWPKPTPPPPPSPIYTPAKDRAPSEKETERMAQVNSAMLAATIERALTGRNDPQRETAFALLLPELLQAEPQRVVAMLARQEPGEKRDLLRDEMARQWVARDCDAAIAWIKSLKEGEQRAAAQVAVASLSAVDPPQAIHVANQLGVGRDDGSLEHLVQMWAEENPEAAGSWIASQPDDPGTRQLRVRIAQVLESRSPEPAQ
jgi:hypothetical protein